MANHPNRIGFVDRRATKVAIDQYYLSRDTNHVAAEWAPGYTRMFTFTPEFRGEGLASMTDRHFTTLDDARAFAAKKYPNAKQFFVSR